MEAIIRNVWRNSLLTKVVKSWRLEDIFRKFSFSLRRAHCYFWLQTFGLLEGLLESRIWRPWNMFLSAWRQQTLHGKLSGEICQPKHPILPSEIWDLQFLNYNGGCFKFWGLVWFLSIKIASLTLSNLFIIVGLLHCSL